MKEGSAIVEWQVMSLPVTPASHKGLIPFVSWRLYFLIQIPANGPGKAKYWAAQVVGSWHVGGRPGRNS